MRRRDTPGSPLKGRVVASLIFLSLLALPGAAAADEGPPALWKGCPTGSAAGECRIPKGIATSPITGNVYVVNEFNARIDEFTPWGDFVKAWGWGVRDGASELQTCTTATGCQAGLDGSGPGQLDSGEHLKGPQGIAVDSQGDIYVVDRQNFRVQKFDSDGNFLLMWGGGVDQGPNHPGDVCTAAFITEGDTCGAGTTGESPGRFSANLPAGSYIAVGPEDEIYVGDVDRIQVFDTDGQYQSEIALPAETRVAALAVDPVSGDIYYATFFDSIQVGAVPRFPTTRLDSETGNALGTLATDRPRALAVGSQGNVFVFEDLYPHSGGSSDPERHPVQLVEFDSAGKRIAVFADEVVRDNGQTEFDGSLGIATGSACFNTGSGLYVGNSHFSRSFIVAYGTPDNTDVCPPPPAAPEITAEYARSVDATGAALGADVNPNFWPDTTYRVHYGTAQCIEEGGWEASCVSEHPNGSPSKLDSGVTDTPVPTPNVFLSGLQPDTAYRYRFEAQSSGGGPTLGTGEEFHTAPLATLNTNCPNQVFRSGASAALPDCRAHELVSPLDKAGGDVQARLNAGTHVTRMDQSSLTGEGITFSSARAFAGALGSPFSSQYLARRDPAAGWQTEALNPPQEGPAFISPLMLIDNTYRAFSPELETGWLQTDTEPILGPGGIAGHPNLYRRENGSASYGGCTSAPPQLTPESDHIAQPQGFSAAHDLAVFRIENKLTDDASSQRKSGERGIYQLYACSFADSGTGAQLHLVSVLPNGNTSSLENTVGGPANERFQGDQGRTATLENAVSVDGSRIFWTAASMEDATNPGALYVRLNPTGEPSEPAQCPEEEEPEPGVACTLRINAGPARFWTAAADGSTAIYGVGSGKESLFEYDLATRTSEPIAGETRGVLGASEDASRVYYFSREVLDAGATAGELNLYLHEGDSETFIATLDGTDDAFSEGLATHPSPANPEPVFHSSRVTPNGNAVAFMSASSALAEQVADYDNTDQISGEPAAEIYRYAIGEGLACVSCDRTGARPIGRDVASLFFANASFYAAAQLQPWLNSLYAPRVLSEDGSRIFFESFGPLVSSDTNGKADVYQWELEGTGGCEESDPAFVDASGGCVDLISSGKSPGDSEFVDASASGDDVFIRTSTSLVEWDPGQIDIYDARVNGGFNAPPGIPAGCEGEACQGPIAPPDDPTPASSTFSGAGNVREATKAKRKKAKAKKKAAKKKKAARKRNKAKRRAKGRKAKQGKGKQHRKAAQKRAAR